MKWILFLSLLVNAVLGWRLSRKQEVVREEVVEKVVLKRAEPQVIEKKVIVKVPGEVPESAPAPKEYDEKEVEDILVDVDKAREDFLRGNLGFSEQDFKKLESVKQRFYDRYHKLFPMDRPGPLTLKERRAILDLEEERDAEYARAIGPEKWKEWETFRDSYNQKMYKKMMQEKGVIVPMEI